MLLFLVPVYLIVQFMMQRGAVGRILEWTWPCQCKPEVDYWCLCWPQWTALKVTNASWDTLLSPLCTEMSLRPTELWSLLAAKVQIELAHVAAWVHHSQNDHYCLQQAGLRGRQRTYDCGSPYNLRRFKRNPSLKNNTRTSSLEIWS
jgi:hypothetical protein